MNKFCMGGLPVGPVTLGAEEGKITSVDFGGAPQKGEPDDETLKLALRELKAYFAGTLKNFTVPWIIPQEASPFLKEALKAIAAIPHGKTATYGDLARSLKTSPRAVGQAARRNPIPIIIPCHRVVAAGGLGGYSGDWEEGRALSVKKFLLELESGKGEEK